MSIQIIADSLHANGKDRFTTFLIDFPKCLLAEMNTHRQLCLSGDTELWFDLPSGNESGNAFRLYKMSLKDFYTKWTKGVERPNPVRLVLDESKIFPDNFYTPKQLEHITSKNYTYFNNLRRQGHINTYFNEDRKL